MKRIILIISTLSIMFIPIMLYHYFNVNKMEWIPPISLITLIVLAGIISWSIFDD